MRKVKAIRGFVFFPPLHRAQSLLQHKKCDGSSLESFTWDAQSPVLSPGPDFGKDSLWKSESKKRLFF
jgi:hypothetical protein